MSTFVLVLLTLLFSENNNSGKSFERTNLKCDSRFLGYYPNFMIESNHDQTYGHHVILLCNELDSSIHAVVQFADKWFNTPMLIRARKTKDTLMINLPADVIQSCGECSFKIYPIKNELIFELFSNGEFVVKETVKKSKSISVLGK